MLAHDLTHFLSTTTPTSFEKDEQHQQPYLITRPVTQNTVIKTIARSEQ